MIIDFSKVEFKIVNKNLGNKIALPKYATDKSAGMDIRACIDSPLSLAANETKFISTGFAINIINTNICAILAPRSGLASKHGIILANTVGVIDADYQGEIIVALKNTGKQDFKIESGDRICQLLFMPVYHPELELVSEFSELTKRGSGGFGSTGLN